MVTGHALRIGSGHFSDQKRVFAVALLCASPAGITFRIDCRSPEHQVPLGVFPVIIAGFFAGNFPQLFHEVRIKGRSQPDRLREHGRRLCLFAGNIAPCHFLTHIPFSDAQPFHRQLMGREQVDLFFYGQTGKQVFHPFNNRQAGVTETFRLIWHSKFSFICGIIMATPHKACA